MAWLGSTSRSARGALGASAGFAALAVLLGLAVGPVAISPDGVVRALVDAIPGLTVSTGLAELHETIVQDIRLPRVMLGFLVGASLALSGTAYQGAFRNPLVDPYLLGVAAGAGLGATIALTTSFFDAVPVINPVPPAAFVGALGAVGIALSVGRVSGASAVTLVLAGVAVASFLTALQTYVLQANTDALREVYGWILGRLGTSGWSEPALLAPYFLISAAVLFRYRGALDVLAVGDEEAASLGIDPGKIRLVVVAAASLAAAAAVSVSGLIGFVGIVVPHIVRYLFTASYRLLVPLSVLVGGGFMVLADLAARTVVSPAELPIGVVTAFIGAPLFLWVLRTKSRELW